MRYLIHLLAVAFLVTSASSAGAQNAPVQLDVDHATFAFDGKQTLLEVYLSIAAHSLEFEKAAEAFQTQLPIVMEVVKNGTAAWKDSTTLSFAVADTANTKNQLFVHQVRTTVEPGEYELRVSIPADAAAGRQELELRRPLRVSSFAADSKPVLSDITLSSSLAQSEDRQDLFYKNGLSIRPNPNGVYGQGLSRLFYYVEAYEPVKAASQDGTYTLNTYITESNRVDPIAGLNKSLKRDVRATDVVVGFFGIESLPTGSYVLHVDVVDVAGAKAAEQTRKFFVYNPKVEQKANTGMEIAFESSDYARMLEEDVVVELQQIEYIANERERRQIKGTSNLDEKRRLLKEFWDKRVDNPGSSVNSFRMEFLQRVRFVNERYTNAYGPGWKSDRGRIMIKYGTPSHIEQHQYDREMMPYEIWQYNNIRGEGQSIFIFADRRGFGEYEMIHSTVPGEPSLPDWQRELVR